jgi:methionyl-tRNA formyltransferase
MSSSPLTPGLRIIFAGSGAFGLPALEAMAANVVPVISQPDHPAGRGRKLTPTPIAQFALEHGLPIIRTADINGESLPAADVMVVIAFGQKISQAQANHPRLGSANLHASLLPKYRGAAPINWAILRGETVTGNSVIRLAERMDAGEILGQSQTVIGEVETAGELHDRLAAEGAPLLLNVLNDLAADRAAPKAQDEAAATTAPKLTRPAAVLDFAASAEEVCRRIRGFWPWPGCRVRLTDAAGTQVLRLSLARARPAEGEGPRWHDGEVETTGHICVAGGSASVEILELQPEGRRLMTMGEFRRGHPWMAGMRVAMLNSEC